MTNFEWLCNERKEDLKIILAEASFGLDKDNKITPCNQTNCQKCRFFDAGHCEDTVSEWLDEPHSRFHEGDLVKITNPGGIYSSYVDWVTENIGNTTLIAKWAYEKSISDPHNAVYKEHTYRIIKIAEHSENDDRLLVFIQDTNWLNECFLIGEDSIRK